MTSEAFPEFYAEYDRASGLGTRLGKRFVVNGPLTYNDATVKRDIATLKAAAAKANATGAFLPVVAPASALPGAKNDHYADEKSLLFALADCLHQEYQAIVDAGLHVQVDDAFLPYMHERMVPPMSEAQYRAWAQLRIDALNHALRGIPRGALALSHLLGKLERPARLRRPAEGHRRPAAAGERRRLQRRAGQPAPRARMDGVAERQAAGRARSSFPASSATPPTSSSIRSWWRSAWCGWPRSSAARMCWAAPTAASRRAPLPSACTRASCGRSCARCRKVRRIATAELWGSAVRPPDRREDANDADDGKTIASAVRCRARRDRPRRRHRCSGAGHDRAHHGPIRGHGAARSTSRR